jgi:hypothetical protein
MRASASMQVRRDASAAERCVEVCLRMITGTIYPPGEETVEGQMLFYSTSILTGNRSR